jgi:hypothetical protein
MIEQNQYKGFVHYPIIACKFKHEIGGASEKAFNNERLFSSLYLTNYTWQQKHEPWKMS